MRKSRKSRRQAKRIAYYVNPRSSVISSIGREFGYTGGDTVKKIGRRKKSAKQSASAARRFKAVRSIRAGSKKGKVKRIGTRRRTSIRPKDDNAFFGYRRTTTKRPTKGKGKKSMAKTKTRKAPKRRGRKTLPKNAARVGWKRRSQKVGKTYSGKRGSIRVDRKRKSTKGRKRAKRAPYGIVPRTGKKGTVTYRGRFYKKGKRGSRRVYFTNPAKMITGYTNTLMAAPMDIVRELSGKNMIMNAAYISGGTLATYFAGQLVQNLLTNVPGVNTVMENPMANRVITAAMPFSVGYLASGFVKNNKIKKAMVLGGAAASIVTLIWPSGLRDVLSYLGLGQMLNGADMLAGYVAAPGYQGVGVNGYVEAPSYQGVGGSEMLPGMGNDDLLAGYVEDAGYRGAALNGYLDQPGYLAEASYLA